MGYVDLHCHLLPGLDDGAAAMEDTIAHARRLEAAGVTDVACTPHVKRREYPRVELHALAALRERAQRAIDERGIGLRLHRGGELGHEDAMELTPGELELIAQGPDDSPWLLLETPFEGMDDDFTQAADRLRDLGYDLLLAHPERAADVRGGADRLRALVRDGALLQVNATSLLGRHGEPARRRAGALLREGLVWCLASDGHPGTREDTLDASFDVRLVRDNPRALLLHGRSRLPLAA